MIDLKILFDAIVEGKLEPAVEVTKEAIKEKIDPQILISDYMIKAMEEIGQRFEDGKAYVPELLMSARAMKGSLELIKPLLTGKKSATIGKVVIGTVYGDLHEIGKNLVASMLEGCGFEVVNLGTNISADQFVDAVKKEHADILCLSALLTTTMVYMKVVIDKLKEENMRDKVKVMVGGAPLNEAFARKIGADCYCDNANDSVARAREMVAGA